MAASFGIYYNIIRRGYITWYNVRHIVACGFMMWTKITLRNKMARNKPVPSGSYCKQSFSLLLRGDRFSFRIRTPDLLSCRLFFFRASLFLNPRGLGEREQQRRFWRTPKPTGMGGRCRERGRGDQLLSGVCHVSRPALDGFTLSLCVSSQRTCRVSRCLVAVLQRDVEMT